jgi:hypothetical protein
LSLFFLSLFFVVLGLLGSLDFLVFRLLFLESVGDGFFNGGCVLLSLSCGSLLLCFDSGESLLFVFLSFFISGLLHSSFLGSHLGVGLSL